jgi:argininosuccinate synthase
MKKEDIKKVVLAYSGGLDTSVIIPWLKENYNNCEVIAVSGNVGQADELEGLEERARKSGASKLYIEDLTDEFVNDYIIPTVQAGAKYEEYMLGTSFARPIIAKRLVEIAKAEGADAICHGCTGKETIRCGLSSRLRHLRRMAIIGPRGSCGPSIPRGGDAQWRVRNDIPSLSAETNYSKDKKNLWHLPTRYSNLEDAGTSPQYEKEGVLEMFVSPLHRPDKPPNHA